MGFGADRSVSTSDALENSVLGTVPAPTGCIVYNWYDVVGCCHHYLVYNIQMSPALFCLVLYVFILESFVQKNGGVGNKAVLHARDKTDAR